MLRFLLPFIFIAFVSMNAYSEEAELPVVKVYKSPTCGCCKKWVSHLEENGFQVEATDVRDVKPIKQHYGVPPKLASCHTAVVDGYLVEGHVPAQDIIDLLTQKPKLKGLAVPDMPIGSPGMEVEGREPQAYDVISFDDDGKTAVFSSH